MARHLAVMPLVIVTRDSVCLADDCDAPHEERIEVPPDEDDLLFLTEVLKRYRLASIAGGKATWVCSIAGKAVAVVAQQWRRPRIIAGFPEIVDETEIHFTYHVQRDPELYLR